VIMFHLYFSDGTISDTKLPSAEVHENDMYPRKLGENDITQTSLSQTVTDLGTGPLQHSHCLRDSWLHFAVSLTPIKAIYSILIFSILEIGPDDNTFRTE
jgi:hypothetical protein